MYSPSKKYYNKKVSFNLWNKKKLFYSSALTISLPDDPSKPQLTKKLPDTMTVQKLKGLLQHLYKVDSSDQRLSYISHKVDIAYLTMAKW